MSDNPLKDSYRIDIAAQIKLRRDRIAAASEEIRHLEDILTSLGGPLNESPMPGKQVSPGARLASDQSNPPTESEPSSGGSIPQHIVRILRRSSRGLKATEIINELQAVRPHTAASSVYPSLLRMVAIGTIKRTGDGRSAVYFPAMEGDE